MDVPTLWHRWFREFLLSTNDVRERPYRTLSFLTHKECAAMDEETKKRQKQNTVSYSKARGVINLLLQAHPDKTVTEEKLSCCTDAFLTEVFNICWCNLKAICDAGRTVKIPSTSSYLSVYNFVAAAKKRNEEHEETV
jgi:hypothetical protein